MPQRAELPKIRYSARDFYQIVQALQEYVKAQYSSYWNDFFESNEGQALIDLIAYIGDQLHFYLDKRVNNLFWSTLSRRDFALKLSSLLAYVPQGPVGANLTSISRYSIVENIVDYPGNVFTMGDTITVKGGYWEGQNYIAGTAIQVDDLTFEVIDDVVIVPYGTTPSGNQIVELKHMFQHPDGPNDVSIIQIPMKEGTTRYDKFTGSGEPFQEFISSVGSIIQDSWKVRINGVDWTQAHDNSFLNHPVGSTVYIVEYIADNKIKITFGDGESFGEKPIGDITVVFRVGGGKTTNIAADVLDPDEHKIDAIFYDQSLSTSSIITIKLSNPDIYYYEAAPTPAIKGSARFGADSQPLNVIKAIAPNHLKHTNRAITGDDIENIAKEFALNDEQVFKVKAFRPEGKCGYTTVSGALTQDVTNFPLTYDGKQVFVYFPSYGANIIQVFIWSLGPTGGPYIPDTPDLKAALSNYLNRGDLFEARRLANIGMTSVDYVVNYGGFVYSQINLNTNLGQGLVGVWYDPLFDPNQLTLEIDSKISQLFIDKDPGEELQLLEIWRTVSNISGIIKFGVSQRNTGFENPINSNNPTYSYYYSEWDSVDISPKPNPDLINPNGRNAILKLGAPVDEQDVSLKKNIVFTLIPKV